MISLTHLSTAAAVLLISLPGALRAAEEAASVGQADKIAPGTKAPQLEGETEYIIAFPSPYARMLGIQAALAKHKVEINWAEAYQRLAKKSLNVESLGTDKGRLGFAIGVRLADGIIALMAKDQEKLVQCAKDARACAQKLGIERKDISAGDALLRGLEENDWGKVFFEIGVMQQEIVTRLEKNTPTEKDRSLSALVASGAWLQGVRYAVDVISDNRKTEDLSNMLRAAPLAARLKSELMKAPPEVAALATVKKSIEVLDKVRPLIDIKRDEVIPTETLAQIQALAAGVISEALP